MPVSVVSRILSYACRNAAPRPDLRAQLNAQLLAGMLLVFFAGFAIVDVYQSSTIPGYRVPWFGYGLLSLAFLINRFVSYRVAALMACLMFPMVLFGMFLANPSESSLHSLGYLALGILLATILLRTWEAGVYAALVVGLLCALPVVQSGPPEVMAQLPTPLAMSVLGGVLAFVFSLHRNQLERRRQAQLVASEQRYRSFVANFRGIAYESDAASFRPVLFEGAVESISGHPASRFLAGEIRWDQLIHEDDLPAVVASAERMKTDHSYVADKEYRIRRADGSIAWVRDICQRIATVATGQVTFQGALFDVTENHLLHERLRQSEKMEAVGQLAGGVAHDFNNQLAGIVGFAELLKVDMPPSPELSQYIDSILTASRRASDLTAKLLAFARKGRFLATETDVHALIAEVVSLLHHSVDKRIEIRQELNAEPSFTLGDPSQVQNALLNVALNACDAMAAGGVLTFSTSVVVHDDDWCREVAFDVEPGRYVRVTVSDTGCGIPAHDMKRIFEPFYTTKAPGKGTGMGLAAVYGTLKSHHGAVTVESTVGTGTTFTLDFPLCGLPDPVPPEERPERTGDGTKGRILVVDDEELVLDMAMALLRSMGHTTTGARNGRDAIALFERHHGEFDAVLLDIAMPEMNGQDTFVRLREISSKVQVIVASGYSQDGIAQSLLEAGAAGFVQKPFRHDILRDAVSRAIRISRS